MTTRVLEQKLIDAPGSIAEKIVEKQAIYLKRLRFADGENLRLVENYVPFSRAPELLGFQDLDTVSLYTFLEPKRGHVRQAGVISLVA